MTILLRRRERQRAADERMAGRDPRLPWSGRLVGPERGYADWVTVLVVVPVWTWEPSQATAVTVIVTVWLPGSP